MWSSRLSKWLVLLLAVHTCGFLLHVTIHPPFLPSFLALFSRPHLPKKGIDTLLRRPHVAVLHSQSAAHVTHVPSRTVSDRPRLVGPVSVTPAASLDIPLWRHILRYRYSALLLRPPQQVTQGARPPVTSLTLPVVDEPWQQECMSANHKSHPQGLGHWTPQQNQATC
jgi:hypothetical protein